MGVAIVGGALANKPGNGGEAWVRLSWLLGLRRLGFDAYLVEELSRSACVDAAGAPADFADSFNRVFFEQVGRDLHLDGRLALVGEDGEPLAGPRALEVRELVAEAEVVFNLSGHLGDELLAGSRGRRVYVDLDPGFTQAWHADPSVPFELAGHDRYVTVGLNVGRAGSPLPETGIEWLATLPPIVLAEWPAQPRERLKETRFTTVASWRSGYGPLRIGGRTMGLKHHEFRRAIGLPGCVGGASFELALDIHPGDVADLEALERNGWAVVDPRSVCGDPRAFREYVRGSGAEFSVAQGVYVETSSGWFSDRSAAYLASGRAALVQDTGVVDLPLGEGLLTFSSLEEAAAGAERIAADPVGHGEAARALAETHLDSDVVLGRLLAEIGIGG
ncbi:MAG TPA: hypothetical protein VN752_10400 [Solirubrobacterales bacterium]|nr:hypothetical protein [Solirubrobacterales bacterium]